MTRIFFFFLLFSISDGVMAQTAPKSSPRLVTRPEKTSYTETSRYQDVMDFLAALPKSSRLHQTTFGYTMEGRKLPLVVWGNVKSASPKDVLSSGKLRFFVMANIHAGEVEGKEAMLQLLRELSSGKYQKWADSLVLLIAPIYNADGNERVRLTNRPLQLGPIGGMGQRPNAQDLDLNRDHIKLNSPEARSLVGLLDAYNPHVWMDLHTTDGSVHAYHLTYAPPLNPNVHPSIDRLLREKWLPEVTRTVEKKHRWAFYHYGNLPESGPSYTNAERQPERAWYSFDHRPRFSNNYAALRNILGILSEAYSYATFEERIKATHIFVTACADYAYQNRSAIVQIKSKADAEDVVGQSLSLRSALAKSDKKETILIGEITEERHPYTGETMWRRKNIRIPEEMPVYTHFEGKEHETVPQRYFIPENQKVAIQKLQAHGLKMKQLTQKETLSLQEFQIDSTKTTRFAFQGHKERTVFGKYITVTTEVPEGSYILDLSENRANAKLAFYLLEPRSDDGLLNWNFFDPWLEKQPRLYPIRRQLHP
ncbi:MAG: M14 family metallopeptidase [Rhodothermia bacterium]|nr:M14 family metallopeptidase [Rhodothermia bacterium]